MPPPVTLQRARQLFDLCNAKLCCAASAPAPCIPFQYPDNGCWARAHEMCRLMINEGAEPEKVWIQGSLRVASANKPDCEVLWGWHVAPTLQVLIGGSPQTYVIDPSLFQEPVSQATWKGLQSDPAASLTPTSAAIFLLPSGTDPAYVQSNADLAYHRNLLKLRSVGPSGPPPYTHCMVKPPRTQWFGSIGGNQTRRWFTWGWPASRHVVWTVMPLTPCPGGPQLAWDVAVERSSAAQCTYWITVKNLKSDPITFEGRFDILS